MSRRAPLWAWFMLYAALFTACGQGMVAVTQHWPKTVQRPAVTQTVQEPCHWPPYYGGQE